MSVGRAGGWVGQEACRGGGRVRRAGGVKKSRLFETLRKTRQEAEKYETNFKSMEQTVKFVKCADKKHAKHLAQKDLIEID